MRNLLFMGVFLAFVYLITVITVWFVKKHRPVPFCPEPFSKDVSLVCKGLAIVMIMMAHIANNFGIRYLTPLGSFGVAVFLIFSGYGLETSFRKNGLKGFWFKRLKTAYLPYLIIEIVAWIFLYDGISFYDVIMDLLLIRAMHPYGWYMQCLFLYYLAFYIAQLLSRKNNAIKIAIISLCAIAMFVFLNDLFKQQVFSFVLGVTLASFKDKIVHLISKWYFLAITVVIGCGSLVSRQISFIRNGHWTVYNLAYAIQAIFLALALLSLVHILSQKIASQFMIPFVIVGIISNELYLIHAFIIPRNPTYFKIVLFWTITITISCVVYLIKIFAKRVLFRRSDLR